MNAYRARIVRRSWLVIAAAAVAGVVAALLGGSLTPEPTKYESRAVLRVHDPRDDVRMAPTYATVITSHSGLLAAVSSHTGIPVDDLKDDLTTRSLQNTSLIEITGTGTDKAATRGLVREVVADVTATPPVADVVRAGTLTRVESASEPKAVGGGGLPTIPLAAVFGLLVGLVAAVALDRADPRADDETMVAAASGAPTIDAGSRKKREFAVGDVATLLRRGQENRAIDVRDGHSVELGRLVVTIVPVSRQRRGSETAKAAAGVLRAAAKAAGVPEPLLVVASPGDATLAGSVADQCVLAVQSGAKLSNLTRLCKRMRATGKDADLALLIKPRRDETDSGDLHDLDWLLDRRALIAEPGGEIATATPRHETGRSSQLNSRSRSGSNGQPQRSPAADSTVEAESGAVPDAGAPARPRRSRGFSGTDEP